MPDAANEPRETDRAFDDGLRIRPARDSDADGIIALIDSVYAEYPGCVLDVDRDEPELRTPASSFDAFWVLVDGDRIVGCCAWAERTTDDGVRIGEVKKVYLDRELRGRGLGRRLIETIEDRAHERGVRDIELWSDTRFETAHGVYLRMGYAQTGRTRDLDDVSDSTEYHFIKRLAEA